MGESSDRKRQFVAIRYDPGIGVSRHWRVRAANAEAALARADRAGVHGVTVQTVPAYYFKRYARRVAVIVLALVLSAGVVFGFTRFHFSFGPGDAPAAETAVMPPGTLPPSLLGPQHPMDPGLPPLDALKKHKVDIDLYTDKPQSGPPLHGDSVILSPEEMFQLVDPIGRDEPAGTFRGDAFIITSPDVAPAPPSNGGAAGNSTGQPANSPAGKSQP